jgi:predicted RNA-binding Zn ribbon-like protein
MDFANYTEGAILAADLVNTQGSISGREHLEEPQKLAAFLVEHGLRVTGSVSEDDLTAVRGVRDRLREVFLAESEEETAALINDLLADYRVAPQLTNHDGRKWHLHFSEDGAPVADRLASSSAIGLSMAMHESGRARFGICSADDCLDVFIDTSRNRSRRYCEDSCSTRTNVAAYRARQRA